jgi:poly(A) polymerase
MIKDAPNFDGPTGQIAPQPWMVAASTQSVLAALTQEGGEARFVGGCVRDAVIKRPVKDIDIATHLEPEEVIRRLEAASIHAIPTGIDHGTVTAVVGREHFEITTLRHDVETDGRRAKVAFTGDWEADARRRDFTINALFMTPDGMIHDCVHGLADLSSGTVRFVGKAKERIQEDVLRILRFYRFYAYYGRPPVNKEAIAACRQFAHLLPGLSGERVRNELLRILMAPDPAGIFLLMQGELALAQILPEAKHFGRLRQLAWLEDRGIRIKGLSGDPLRRLGALFDPVPEAARHVAERLRLSNQQTERLVKIAAADEPPQPEMNQASLKKLLRRIGTRAFLDRALIAWAERRSIDPLAPESGSAIWGDLLALPAGWTPPEFPLRGRDLMALGIPHGPQIGRLLKEIEAWWEAGGYQADRDEIVSRLKQSLT